MAGKSVGVRVYRYRSAKLGAHNSRFKRPVSIYCLQRSTPVHPPITIIIATGFCVASTVRMHAYIKGETLLRLPLTRSLEPELLHIVSYPRSISPLLYKRRTIPGMPTHAVRAGITFNLQSNAVVYAINTSHCYNNR